LAFSVFVAAVLSILDYFLSIGLKSIF